MRRAAHLAMFCLVGLTMTTARAYQDSFRFPQPSPRPETTPAVLITEVMYYPTSGAEWVELYNPGSSPVSLDGWLLTDNEGTDVNEGEYWFPGGTTLSAHGYLVVGKTAGGDIDLSWGSGGPVLANTGDEMQLVMDPEGDGKFSSADVVDGFRYSSSWGGRGNGKSLSRTCLDCASSDASSWTSSLTTGGTPGAYNDTLPDETTPTPTPVPPGLPGEGLRVLFDQAHCQTCGNADWIITGGYSDFADALLELGFEVSSTKNAFTSSLLSGYDVLVIPEPNSPFSSTEQSAMVDFLKAGKGIYMIADHYGADRNSDGWDSVEVFNGYKSGTRSSSNDWLANNFKFRFKEKTYSQDPVTDVRNSAITENVSSAGLYGGTTEEVLDSAVVKGVIYLNDTSKGPMTAMVTPTGGGRIVAHGDSSTFDDGTCSCSDNLYDNWYDHDHATLGVNSVLWLAGVN